MGLEVIGAGFGRTGTLALKHALERLGLGPCYHMLEVRESHPEHAPLWERAADGESIDWDALLHGYRAAVDWPACHFWRELAQRYPQAPVILTVRDPEQWYRSFSSTILPALTSRAGGEAAGGGQREPRTRMAEKIILERTFGGRADDPAHAMAVFEAHRREVEASLPPERLLVYEVGQGWEPLCRFLGREVPEEPFPYLNTTAEFQARLASRAQGEQRS